MNTVRSADGFTASYEGRPVSVQAVGMGVPSAAIYYTELIRFYGCTTLIRIGSCGGLGEDLALGDVVVATAAGSESAAPRRITGGLAVLYALAMAEGVRGLGLLTVSDDLVRGERLSSKDREDTFDKMVKVALDLA